MNAIIIGRLQRITTNVFPNDQKTLSVVPYSPSPPGATENPPTKLAFSPAPFSIPPQENLPMAIPTSPLPVARFAGLLAGTPEELAAARFELTQWYGKIDDQSEILPFTFTDFYHSEMGTPLLRQWVRFEALFSPEHLAKCKLETNMLETLLAKQFPLRQVPRPINIDPGYIHKYKIILATTKDHSHRVYLSEGIYAEVTLHWHQNVWTPWPWTYADHKTDAAQSFFARARAAYLAQLHRLTGG